MVLLFLSYIKDVGVFMKEYNITRGERFCCQYFVIRKKKICFAVAMSNLIHDVQTSYAKENCSFTDINRI